MCIEGLMFSPSNFGAADCKGEGESGNGDGSFRSRRRIVSEDVHSLPCICVRWWWWRPLVVAEAAVFLGAFCLPLKKRFWSAD